MKSPRRGKNKDRQCSNTRIYRLIRNEINPPHGGFDHTKAKLRWLIKRLITERIEVVCCRLGQSRLRQIGGAGGQVSAARVPSSAPVLDNLSRRLHVTHVWFISRVVGRYRHDH